MTNITKNKTQKKNFSTTDKPLLSSLIVDQWASFLDKQDWHLWTTLTTGHELTLPGSRRAINKLSDYLKFYGYPAKIFWVAEPFDTKEGFHIHSLISFENLDKYEDNREAHKNLIAGWRQITCDSSARTFTERYKDKDSGGGANFYVGKYMMKSKCDYDFIKPSMDNDADLHYHNEEKHPGIELTKQNKFEFAAWKKQKKAESKEYKKEIKQGTFISRDNAPIFEKPKYNPGIIMKTAGRFENKYKSKQNVRLTIDYRKHHHYEQLNSTVIDYQYRDEQHKPIVHKTGLYKGVALL